jgi:hypothetical protein
VLAFAAVAFAVGAAVGANHATPPADSLARSYVTAWTRHDYAAMYAELDPAARRSLTSAAFADAIDGALRTATATGARVAGHPHQLGGGRVAVPVAVSTRIFGTLPLEYELTVGEANGEPVVRWTGSAMFPGLHDGEALTRRTTLPSRAPLLARDGSVLAAATPSPAMVSGRGGETSRGSPLGEGASAAVGTVGAVAPSHRLELEALGVPADALVGVSGLEQALDDRLRGVPGGELLAGTRVLASAVPRPAAPVRTSISPALQRASVAALGGLYGGIVAIQPATGQILAVAGIGLDGLQPPGSTFKMITLSGVLAAGVATPTTVFPYATYATLDGVKLHNANGEECGGTLENAFAVSCNSVFTPLGVKLGAPRLVQTAEGFGFNHDTGIPGAPASTLPPAGQITGELDVGSTAIGQGEVLATPLGMATVAATIADGGRRPQLSFLAGGHPVAAARAVSPNVARTVRRLMVGVVRSGTGTAAAIPGVTVAGKTGTAELKSPCPAGSSSEGAAGEQTTSASSEGCQGGESEASNTDAWFAAFAPALHPRVVVCVLLVKDGAGGATAAPIAREVLEAALHGGALPPAG